MRPKQKESKKLFPIPGDPSDCRGFPALVADFFTWWRVNNRSEYTLRSHSMCLATLAGFLLERGVTRPCEVTRPMVERFQEHLFHARKRDGKPLSFRSQQVFLNAARTFYKWLGKNRHILANPVADIEMPKAEYRLPQNALTAGEAEQILAGADPTSAVGLRDRAMLEVFYSTGIRRQELANLKVFDVDFDRGTLMIRQGKGKKDRMIPIGERALEWVEKYRQEVRPQFLSGAVDTDILFLTAHGQILSTASLTTMVREYVAKSGLRKSGSCHLFRHTMATLMLENGADIRYIQMMLGHASMKTTEIYTHVSIRALKEVHTRTHPAHLRRTIPTKKAETSPPAGIPMLPIRPNQDHPAP